MITLKTDIENEKRKNSMMVDNVKSIIKKNNISNELPSSILTLKTHLDGLSKKMGTEIITLQEYTQTMDVEMPYNDLMYKYLSIDDIVVDNLGCGGTEYSILERISNKYNGNVDGFIQDHIKDVYRETPYINGGLIIDENTPLIFLRLKCVYLLYKRLYKSFNLLLSTRIPSIKLYNITITPLIVRLKGVISDINYDGDIRYREYVKNVSKTLDDITTPLSTYVIQSLVFEEKKKELQLASYVELAEYVNSNSCDGFSKYEYVAQEQSSSQKMSDILNSGDIISELECDINTNDITPSKPFIRKIKDLECGEGNKTPEHDVYETSSPLPIPIQAKIANITYQGEIGNTIEFLSNINGFIMPISGVVTKITQNEIYLSNIKDEEIDTSIPIDKLINLYKEISYIEDLIFSVYHITLYPEMVYNSQISNDLGVFNKTVSSKYSQYLDKYTHEREQYESRISTLCEASNVEEKASNNQLEDLTNEINNTKKGYIKNIDNIRKEYIISAKSCRTEKEDNELIEYYIYDVMFNIIDLQSDISELLKNKISSFISNRKGRDGFSNDKMIDFLTKKIHEVSGGKITLSDVKNVYKQNNSVNDVYTFLYNKTQKSIEAKKIAYMVYYYNIPSNGSTIHITNETRQESIELKNFWEYVFEQYSTLEGEIKNIYTELDFYSTIDFSYVIHKENGQTYRLYTNTTMGVCDKHSEPLESELNPNTKIKISDIRYWRKYMNMATITGCLPIYWSVGFIALGVPIPLPIIYTPIKVINTTWGNIVIGLGVCGIAISPMILYVNLKNNLVSVIPNAQATILNSTISSYKQQLADLQDSYNKNILPNLHNDLYDKHSKICEEILLLDRENSDIKANLPNVPKILTNKDRILPLYNYSDVNKIKIEVTSEGYTSNCDKLKAEYIRLNDLLKASIKQTSDKTTYNKHSNILDEYLFTSVDLINKYSNNLIQINNLNDAKYEIDKKISYVQKKMYGIEANGDVVIETVYNTEKTITALEGQINILEKNLSDSYLSIPLGVLSPNSINFGPSIKKYSLVSNIDKNIDEKITYDILNPIIEKMTISPNSLLDTPMNKNISDMSISNCLKTIDNIIGILYVKDIIPKYEKLSPSNIKFLYFLTSAFCVCGSKQYGLPGYP